ncbi:RNA polymerase sigma factor [Actinoplanes sp. NPDC049265]|uniref:RNA polymerase sigma factor n=1 Tax=Actinoplanes sp. NPDC049265 TaxID=3363902 RepID=UPI003711D8EA
MTSRRSGPTVEPAFEKYFHDDFPRVVAFLRAAGFSALDSEDAASEAMTSAYSAWTSIEHPASWIRTAAYRVALRTCRRQREELPRAVRGGWGHERNDHPHDDIDSRDRLVRWLKHLPDKQRTVIALELDGFDDAGIAGILGIQPSTVRSHRRHAYESLKEVIENEPEPPRRPPTGPRRPHRPGGEHH